jgi:hypothetical protein
MLIGIYYGRRRAGTMKEAGRTMTELAKKRFGLWRDVVRAGDFVRGSVVLLRRPCTYPGCRLCRDGKKHPATYLSLKEKGRTTLVYLPKRLVCDAKRWAGEWRRLDELLREMSRTNVEVLRLLAKRESKPKGGR